MPYTEKQRKFFGLVASGKKPRAKTDLTAEEAEKMLHEAKRKGQKKALMEMR